MPRQFEVKSSYEPAGDQPEAIKQLVEGIHAGLASQILLGVTGSGKTYTMANVVAELQRPTIVMLHNKTLAAQLYGEFKEFFPNNAVEYFVSYYDYYQPEAYVPSSDTFIEGTSGARGLPCGCNGIGDLWLGGPRILLQDDHAFIARRDYRSARSVEAACRVAIHTQRHRF